MSVVIEAASAAHAPGLLALFEATGSVCYCRYWHFAGDKNAWLERCAAAPGESREELSRALAAGSDEARGVVALLGAETIGWLKVAPRAAMDKLYDQRLYRRLPCFEGVGEGVFVIGCVLVHPAHRRRGVATAMVAGAVRLAPAWGAAALEAFPRRPRERVSDEELWTGPAGAFLENGFAAVDDFEPYPVLRRGLT